MALPSFALNDDSGLMGGNGCSQHPDCFTCPFVRCLLDAGAFASLQEQRAAELRERIQQAHVGEGLGVTALTVRFGVARRTVQRAIKAGRQQEEEASSGAVR